jgi:glutaminyl-peptide cyclotransferase
VRQNEPSPKPNPVRLVCCCRAVVITGLLLLAASCARTSSTNPSETKTSREPSAEVSPVPPDAQPPEFNASRAMQYVKEIVALGPRPLGSDGHKKAENYILAHLKGDQVERDDFEITTLEGRFPVHNIIARYPGTKDGVIVLASHYDTNWPLRKENYLGANDGASSSALLLEIANHLRGKKREGYSVWLLWDDAEESMKLPWDDRESLYGVKHLADQWQAGGTLGKIKAFLLEDMIGDADLNVERDVNSTEWLEDLIGQAATGLGYQSHFFGRQIAVTDDHTPFLSRGVPSADLIDLDYGYNNVFHHTIQDTLDKLSPKSLAIVGTVTLQTVRMLDQR